MTVTMMLIICVLWPDVLIDYVFIIANCKQAKKPTVYKEHTLPYTLTFFVRLCHIFDNNARVAKCDSNTYCSDPFTSCTPPVLQQLT